MASIASGRSHVADIHGDEPKNPGAWGWRFSGDDWRPQGARVGWIDGDNGLYLEPDAFYAAVQKQGRDVDEPLTISNRTLRKRLHERGLLASTDKSRQTLTVRRTVEGRRRDVLHISARTLSSYAEKPGQPDREGEGPVTYADSTPPPWPGRAPATRPTPDQEVEKPDHDSSPKSNDPARGAGSGGARKEPDHEPGGQGKRAACIDHPPNDRVGRALCTEVEQKNAGRSLTLVTDPEGLATEEKSLEDTDTVALDLETTGLDPQQDRIRLLSLATPTGTYIVDLFKVDPRTLFPLLARKTVVAHNALFDLGFLATLGFEPG